MVHPEYNARTVANDIALVELEQALVFNRRVRPACLWPYTADFKNNTALAVAGWGVVDSNGTRPHILQKATLYSLDLPDCNSTLMGLNYYKDAKLNNGLNEGQICALNDKSDSCWVSWCILCTGASQVCQSSNVLIIYSG